MRRPLVRVISSLFLPVCLVGKRGVAFVVALMPPRRKPILPQERAAPTFACTVLRTARAGQTKITAVGHMCGEIATFVPTPHLTEFEKHSARQPDGRSVRANLY